MNVGVTPSVAEQTLCRPIVGERPGKSWRDVVGRERRVALNVRAQDGGIVESDSLTGFSGNGLEERIGRVDDGVAVGNLRRANFGNPFAAKSFQFKLKIRRQLLSHRAVDRVL